jgi:aldehyde dehydrogenase (NAD+)
MRWRPRAPASNVATWRTGQVFVNEWFASGIATPFGGVGKSGYGREKGLEALPNYVRTKNVAISLKG